MGMFSVIRVRVHHNNPIHHMGMGEQCYAAPVKSEQNQKRDSCYSIFFNLFTNINERNYFPRQM